MQGINEILLLNAKLKMPWCKAEWVKNETYYFFFENKASNLRQNTIIATMKYISSPNHSL